MLENLMIAGAMTSFCAGAYYTYKARSYMKVFDTTERVAKMFNIGYLDSL